MAKTEKSVDELVEIIKELQGIPKDEPTVVITRRALSRFEAIAFLEGVVFERIHPWPSIESEYFRKALGWIREHLFKHDERSESMYRDQVLKAIRKMAEKKDAEEAKALEEFEKKQKKSKRRKK